MTTFSFKAVVEIKGDYPDKDYVPYEEAMELVEIAIHDWRHGAIGAPEFLEHFDTEDTLLFVEHNGVKVYHCLHDGCISEWHYTTDPNDADIDSDRGDAQFDVRDLPRENKEDNDWRAIIIAAIEAGIITEDGAEPIDSEPT